MESNQNNMRESEREVAEQPTHFLSEEDSIDNEPQEYSTNQDRRILAKTIWADVMSNRKFLARQTKITLAIITFIFLLEILPSPLIQTKVENDPTDFVRQPCLESSEQCGSVGEGYETIVIKHVNPLQRELKYFVRLNKAKLDELSEFYPEEKIDINKQITWVEIYASRNGEIYGDVIYEKDGDDIYQIIFDEQPLIFIGEVHILEEQSYIVKIYKVIKTVKVPDDRTVKMPDEKTNKTDVVPPSDTKNQTIPEKNNTRDISVPLTVQLVRYSSFYTVSQLVVRYISFLFVLYVRIQTKSSPIIFHIILILVSNPLIFIELASPNFATNCVSNVFGSTYLAYLAVFLYYWHRKLKNSKVNVIVIIIKILAFVGLAVASVMRQLHLVNQTKIEFIQTILMCVVLLPLLHHLWKLYFFKIKTILHRNVLFISLTIYYLLFLFLSGYLVRYGWKKISSYIIVQAYGIELCYLTSSIATSDKVKSQELVQERQVVNHTDSVQIPPKNQKSPKFLSEAAQLSPQVSSQPFIPVN